MTRDQAQAWTPSRFAMVTDIHEMDRVISEFKRIEKISGSVWSQ